ncbi:MAG: hypothetical protein GYA17_06995 [Chloroflexi bacterium]|nr:hypothetical protein [Chloroflexota bacterium]
MTAQPRNPDLRLPDCPPRHFSFLLRCMETRSQPSNPSEPGSNWRFSLQDPKSEAVHNFRNFEALVAFLQSVLEESHTLLPEKGNENDAA